MFTVNRLNVINLPTYLILRYLEQSTLISGEYQMVQTPFKYLYDSLSIL